MTLEEEQQLENNINSDILLLVIDEENSPKLDPSKLAGPRERYIQKGGILGGVLGAILSTIVSSITITQSQAFANFNHHLTETSNISNEKIFEAMEVLACIAIFTIGGYLLGSLIAGLLLDSEGNKVAKENENPDLQILNAAEPDEDPKSEYYLNNP